MIYITLLFLIYLIVFVKKNGLGKVDIAFFVILAIVSGVRYEVGTDFINYKNWFQLISMNQEVSVEPGFLVISKILISLNANDQWVYMIFSILTMYFLYKGLKYYTDEKTSKPVLYIIMLLYFFIPSLNVMRQILAASIILYASRHIVNRSFIRFFIWTLVAILFHYSSVIFFILYFFATKTFSRKFYFLVLFISILLSYYGLITKALEFIKINLGFLDFNGYITYYLDSLYNAKNFEFGIVFLVNISVMILFILMKDKLILDTKMQLVINFFYLYILSYILSVDAYVFTRFNYFFGIYMAISVSRFSSMFDLESKRIIDYILVILYSILFIYYILVTQGHGIIPYNYNLKLV